MRVLEIVAHSDTLGFEHPPWTLSIEGPYERLSQEGSSGVHDVTKRLEIEILIKAGLPKGPGGGNRGGLGVDRSSGPG